MDPKIRTAIHNAIALFAGSNGLNAEAINDEMVEVFSAEEDFLSKVDLLDETFDNYPQLEELQQIKKYLSQFFQLSAVGRTARGIF